MKKLFALMIIVGAMLVVGCSGGDASSEDAATSVKGAKTVDGKTLEGEGQKPITPN